MDFHPVANIFPLLQGDEYEQLKELEVSGLDFEKKTFVKIWPSKYSGYSWIAVIKDGLLETLESPVLHQYLPLVTEQLGVNIENTKFWTHQYTGDGYNDFLISPKKKEKQSPKVYFIQARVGGPIKIGVAFDVDDRLAQLQRMNPFGLRVLATADGGYELEAKLHKKLDYARLHGEWFEPVDDLINLIQGYQK